MESVKMKTRRATIAFVIGSALCSSACDLPNPKTESIQSIEKSRSRGITLSPGKAVDNFQRKFIEDFLKGYEERAYSKPFSKTSDSDNSKVSVEYFTTGENEEIVDDAISARKKEIEYHLPPHSEIAKVTIVFEEPVQFGSAWSISNELYYRLFVMHGGDEAVFGPERDRKGNFTGNIETIVFWTIKGIKNK